MRPEQRSFFDEDAGNRARDEAIRRVNRHAPPDWKEKAYAAGVYLARSRVVFTTDDIWALVGDAPENRAMGPLTRRLVRDGHCWLTGIRVRSLRPIHHRGPLEVYASRYNEGGMAAAIRLRDLDLGSALSTVAGLSPENRDA